MAVVQKMCALALQQLTGESASNVLGILGDHFSDRGQLVIKALRVANDRAWKALEVALVGDSWWQQFKSLLRAKEDQAFAQQIKAFLEGLPLEALAGQPDEFRRNCLSELQHARQKKLLTEGSLSTQQLTAEAKGLLDADPHSLVQARWEGLRGVADELRQAGYSRLAWLIHPIISSDERSFLQLQR